MSSFILCLLAVLAIAAATASMSSPDGLKYMDKNAKKKGVKVPGKYKITNIGSTGKRGRPAEARGGEALGPKGKKKKS